MILNIEHNIGDIVIIILHNEGTHKGIITGINITGDTTSNRIVNYTIELVDTLNNFKVTRNSCAVWKNLPSLLRSLEDTYK